MKTNMKCSSIILKVIVMVLLILLGTAVQTAYADATSYEVVHVSDLKEITSDGEGKTKLKCGGYIWVGDDFNGDNHHDVYFQKEKDGITYLILDYFDLVDYCDVLITDGKNFYYADVSYFDNEYGIVERPPIFMINKLSLGESRKQLAAIDGQEYGYGYQDRFELAGYYDGYVYYSLSGAIYRDAPGRLYKVNVKTGKTTRVYKNFTAFAATGNGRYIYGYTTDVKNHEIDHFVIYDCKQKKKVRSIAKGVFYAEVMNGKLYFYEPVSYYKEKGKVYEASLSGKNYKRILQVSEMGDMYQNGIYYGLEQEYGSMEYYRYNVKTGKKSKIDSENFQILLQLSRAEFGYKN